MKIIELRFQNLNSLYGEWSIDFTDPEYASNGLFAITGPTGAGKSTILDAICLALYGATPRLGKITKSGNDIMSRQTGECYAEVLFESQFGQFRCHWEQRRARKNATGKLQDQEHQVVDAKNGKPIETKKSLVAGVIEEKTGMDFDRFTRSILLAQGGFDTFLKANVEQKSKILEQITGTEIYSAISCRVYERQREEREKWHMLNAQTSGIVLLDQEQEEKIQEEMETAQQQESELAGKYTQIRQAITWRNTINELKNEILSLKNETTQLNADTAAFKPERSRLEQALKAMSLDGKYATLTSLRKQQEDDQAALETEESILAELKVVANTLVEELRRAEQRSIKAKEDLKVLTPLFLKIRWLDQKIADQNKAVLQSTEACNKDAAKIKTDKQVLSDTLKKQIDAEKIREGSALYLRENVQDEWLIGGLAGIEEQFGSLLALQEAITHKENDLKKAHTTITDTSKQLEIATQQCFLQRQELDSIRADMQNAKASLNEQLGDKQLREYRTEKETLLREMAFIRKIEELEDHRAKLKDGKPCPLCGSETHPFAEGNVPVPHEMEQKIDALNMLITAAENQEIAIKKQEQRETTALYALHDSEKLENDAANAKNAAEKMFAEGQNVLAKFRTDFNVLKDAVSEKIRPLGIREIPESETRELCASLRLRLQKWQQQAKDKSEVEKHIAAIDSEIKRLGAVIDTQANTLTEKQENLEQLKKELADRTDERQKLYGDKKPDDEEDYLNTLIADAEAAEKKARDRNTELQQKLTTSKTHVESLKKRIEQRTPELKKSEADFSTALIPAGLADEKALLEARLSQEDRESLSSRAKELDDAGTELQAKQKDRETRLATEITKKLTDNTVEELEQQFKEYENSLKELRDAIAGLKHKLYENTAAKERIKEKQSAIEAQKKEYQRWEKLYNFIGSADGKKYRNFAQGLTFELMVSHANRQLEKMTDRYLLIRHAQQALELNVVDNYQAGEIRSTKNLSGGESFIVSLSLALGLSKMASRKVRVDSLFLDEGFGTLDEEALETALDTLSSLQQDGKLIGIISHVSVLKERISTQVNITPISGGRSALSGPGCKKLLKTVSGTPEAIH